VYSFYGIVNIWDNKRTASSGECVKKICVGRSKLPIPVRINLAVGSSSFKIPKKMCKNLKVLFVRKFLLLGF
jgi:hypothetical protein